MYEAFVNETKIDLKKVFDTEKVGNPVSDIVDSYYIMKVGNVFILFNTKRGTRKYLEEFAKGKKSKFFDFVINRRWAEFYNQHW